MQQWYQCPRCSTQVAYGTKFCGNCGTQLNWPTQQQQPPNYQPPQQPPPQHQQQYQQPVGYQQQLRKNERNWFTFHKENLIALAIGLAFIAAGLGLFYFGLLASLGILPLPIIGVLIILFAVYRIIRGQKGD
jgi:hypothetical protein